MQVLEVDGDEIKVKYMKATSRNSNLFLWPKTSDISWQDKDDIIKVVKPPTLANSREQFKFSESELEQIKSQCKLACFY